MLVERSNFVPLPYRGDPALGKPGAYQSYTLQPGGEALRGAVVDILVGDLGGERLPEDPSDFRRRVRVRGKTVSVAVLGSASYVHVTFDSSDSDPQVMSAIAATVDTALASGKYDPLFVQSR